MNQPIIPNSNPALRIAYVRHGEDYPEAVEEDGPRFAPIIGWRPSLDGRTAQPVALDGFDLMAGGIYWVVTDGSTAWEGAASTRFVNWRKKAAQVLRHWEAEAQAGR